MAKGQKRSTREIKKPKASAKKPAATAPSPPSPSRRGRRASRRGRAELGRLLRLLFGRRRYQRRWGRIAAAAATTADRARPAEPRPAPRSPAGVQK